VPEMRYADALNAALHEAMAADPAVIVFGEDVGGYGGVFGVTRGLQARFGRERVRDTPISEAAIAGLAIGSSMMGMRPVAEIMYADFLPIALDQLINQAAVLPWIWNHQISLPFVLRTQGGVSPGAAAQHAKSLEALVAHVPGLKVVMPSTPADAKGLLTAAIRDPDPVVVIEHKLLYSTAGPVPEGEHVVPVGKAAVRRAGKDVTVVATSRMVLEAMEAADLLANEGIEAEVVDVRTLRPLDSETILASVRRTKHAVVVGEAWRTGGFGAELSATIAEQAFDRLRRAVVRLGAADRPTPYAEAMEQASIPDAARIACAVRELLT